MVLPTPPPYTNPIPNDPFYSPESSFLQGPYGPLVIGTGLSVNYNTSVLSATGGGGGGGGGSVTSVGTGAGLTGGPITGSGVISLTTTGVASGTYTYATITVDTYGRLSAASSGTAPVSAISGTAPISVTGAGAKVVSIAAASTSGSGAVQLYNNTDSTSTTLALTAAQGYALQQQLNAVTAASNLILAGTFNAGTGLMVSVTTDGGGAGFTVGAALPSPAAGNTDYFVIVTTPGTYDPPGPTGSATFVAGDWILSSGTQWDRLAVGNTASYATTSAAGIVCLSTNILAQAGTDSTTALTPAAARSAFVPNACYATKGDLLGATNVPSAFAVLPIGTAGQVLTVDALAPTGFTWKTPVETGTVSTVNTGTGLTGGPITSTGIISLANTSVVAGSYTNANLTVDAQGRLTAASNGVVGIPCSCITGKGALISGTAASAVTALPVGTGGQVLTVDLACPSGLTWSTPAPLGVTSVNTGTGLTGGPITTTGTINLANTTVTAGSYTNAALTVDAQGRLTAASSGLAPVTAVTGTAPVAVTAGTTPIVSIGNASTTALGAVQLYDNVDSNSTTLALTANQGCALQAQISALSFATNLTLAGTFDAAAGVMLTATTDGVAAGFTATNPLPAPAAGNTDYFVIVTTPGTFTPPGPTGPFTLTAGDWLLSSGTQYDMLDVGFTSAYATTTSSGSVCLSTNALAQAGTDTITALTPAAARSAFVANACFPNKGDIVAGSSTSNTPVTVAVGTAGQVLTVDSTAATGFAWKTPATSGTVTSVATGAGLTGGPIVSSGTIALSDTTVSAGSYTNASFTVDAQGRLTAASDGVAGIPCACILNKGSLLAGTAPANVTALAVGTDGQVLVADSTCTTGMKWAPASATGVTSVNTGTGLTGGPITTTGTIALADTAVTAGSYTNASITVDAQGRLTAASDGTTAVTAVTGTAPINVTAGTAPVVSIDSSSTTALGAVQLTNALNNTSETLALTACAGKSLQDQITALSVSGTIELAGTIDASTGDVLSITSVGTTAGYTVGDPLPAADATTNNTYVIVTTPGTMTPPGGSAATATRGDWFLAAEITPGNYSWEFLNVGFDAPAATTTLAGIVCLSTDALAQAGTDTTTALTPAAAASAYIPKACVSGKGALVTGTAASTPDSLAVGADGTILAACSTATNGLCWIAGPANATPTAFGLVKGCTDATSATTALGANALKSITTGIQNSAVGFEAMCSATTGTANDAFGQIALTSLTSGCYNAAFGWAAGCAITTGCYNVAVGHRAGQSNQTGNYSTALGFGALSCATGTTNTAVGALSGKNITTGTLNVIIGSNVDAPNPAGSCQLAIGYDSSNYWLTGCSDKSIRPGAGIRDCAGNLGSAGQVLCSTGAAVQWATPSGSCYAVGICAPGSYLALDDFEYSLWTGCRSFVIRNRTAGNKIIGWTTGACNAITNSWATFGKPEWTLAPGVARFFYDNLNLTTFNASQTALISVYANASGPGGAAGPALCVYCFTGIIGDAYCQNWMCINRLY